MRKKTKRNTSPLFTPMTTLAALPILFLLVGVFAFTFVAPKKPVPPKQFSELSIPKEPGIVLPDPLALNLTTKSPYVLGTVDPNDIITYINEERMKTGARPLRVNPILTKAAEMRANVILKHQNFSHQDPFEGIQLDTVLPLLKYPFTWASENIGMGDNTARAFANGFMNSPSHKANLLNPYLVETGGAVVTGPYKQYYVNIFVQIFAIPTDPKTYVGYTDKDFQDYKQLLADITTQLEDTRARRTKDPDNAEYYDKWERILIRQQEIVATLVHTMAQDQPFARMMIALIKEYNTNLKGIAN